MKIDGDDLVKGVILSEALSEDPPQAEAPQPSSPADTFATWAALIVFGIGLVVLAVLVGVVWHFVSQWTRGGGG